MPAARCQESGFFKMYSSNFYNRSLKAKLFIDAFPGYNPELRAGS